MSSPFLAEIRILGCNFAPKGWAFCDGQILPISQNTALFSLLGTTYGGDGRSNFALPNLQGSAPMHTTQYSGNSPFGTFNLGQSGGEDYVTLLQSEMPAHTHAFDVASLALPASSSTPAPTEAVAKSNGAFAYDSAPGNQTPFSPQSLAITGGSQPHNNLMPYLVMNFCIAMQGVFPPRS